MQCALSDKTSTNHKAENSTALRKAVQQQHGIVQILVCLVHYKPCSDREPKIDKHVRWK